MPDDEFQGDKTRFNGLAQAHVVGDQQVDPWHLDGPDHGIELIILDVDAGAERGLDVLQVGGRSRPPANGIEESVEALWCIEPRGFRQGDLLDDLRPRLDLPDDLKLFPGGVILDREQRDEMLSAMSHNFCQNDRHQLC